MSDETAFVRQMQDDATDRVTPLVYADWLDDQGDADRAAFLRLQHRLLAMVHGQRGLLTWSRRLLRLGRSLPADWLTVVSRPRLTGTAWAGDDSDGDRDVFRYLPDGVLNYTSPSGTFQNGTWRQIGNTVLMEMNRHYADYTGLIAGDRIVGSARNVTRHRWTWDVRRTTDPALCDPGDPDTTIYGTPRRRRRQ
ncbi:MAG: TIGR02996 domain-containing protein [Gemmataceae bacterium]